MHVTIYSKAFWPLLDWYNALTNMSKSHEIHNLFQHGSPVSDHHHLPFPSPGKSGLHRLFLTGQSRQGGADVVLTESSSHRIRERGRQAELLALRR